MLVGVLALQGDFAEHVAALERTGAAAREVRQPRDLEGLDGIIIPGGESTTIARLLDAFGLFDPLQAALTAGLPAWGTCAGMILLAKEVTTLDRPTLGVMDIHVVRNAYGRQVDSFEEALTAPRVSPDPQPAIFIRAPRVVRVGSAVDVIARTAAGDPVAVQQSRLLATSFHPELTGGGAWHRYFVRAVVGGEVAVGVGPQSHPA